MINKSAVILIILAIGLCYLIGQPGSYANVRATDGDALAFSDQRESVPAAAFWLVTRFQNDDGGYASFSNGANQSPSTIGGTLDAMLAISAAGFNPWALFPTKTNSPVGYLETNTTDLSSFAATNGGQAGKVVLALTAAAIDPRNFGGHDYVAVLTGQLDPSGAYGVGDAFKQSMAILGLVSAREPVPNSAVDWLKDKQSANGSWDDGFGTANNPDTTAVGIMALLAAGQAPVDPQIQLAKTFLKDTQLTDGWEYGSGFGASANSTALVIQALSALGEDWYSPNSPWIVGGNTPLQALLSFQSESGAFQSDFGQGPFDDFYATVQGIPAAAGRPYPLPGRFEAARAGVSCLEGLQDDQTGGWPSFAGGPVDAQGTSRAIQALTAAGYDPRSAQWTTPGGIDAVEALETLTPPYLSGGRGGRVGIVMQGVVAAGPPSDVNDFAGENLPLLVAGHLSPAGDYDSLAFGIFAHAEAMLGLLKSGNSVAPSSIEALRSAQSNGDWGDPDSNGIALQVLGSLSRGISSGTLVALHQSQNADGGWGFGGVSNPSTSSEVVQGLIAAGQNPFSPGWSYVVDGRLTNAADITMANQDNNGCWPNAFGPGDDPYSTTDAILLLTSETGWGFSSANLPYVTSGW